MKLRGGRVIGRVGCCRKFGRPRPRERRHRPLAAVRSDTSHVVQPIHKGLRNTGRGSRCFGRRLGWCLRMEEAPANSMKDRDNVATPNLTTIPLPARQTAASGYEGNRN